MKEQLRKLKELYIIMYYLQKEIFDEFPDRACIENILNDMCQEAHGLVGLAVSETDMPNGQKSAYRPAAVTDSESLPS